MIVLPLIPIHDLSLQLLGLGLFSPVFGVCLVVPRRKIHLMPVWIS